jgi:hypothetical protein
VKCLLDQQQIDGRLFILIALLNETEGTQVAMHAVPGAPATIQFTSHTLRKQDLGKKKGELREQVEVIECDDAGTVNDTRKLGH